MDITPYVESLQRDLAAASEAGGEDIKQAADRLALAMEPAARLAFMEAISQAASEITAEMPDGCVDVRLCGRELDFVVQGRAPQGQTTSPVLAESSDEPGDIELARVTLRIPESVKTKAEERAAAAGQSLNTWLVNVVRGATSDSAINIDLDLSSIPFRDAFGSFSKRGARSMSGWVQPRDGASS